MGLLRFCPRPLTHFPGPEPEAAPRGPSPAGPLKSIGPRRLLVIPVAPCDFIIAVPRHQ